MIDNPIVCSLAFFQMWNRCVGGDRQGMLINGLARIGCCQGFDMSLVISSHVLVLSLCQSAHWAKEKGKQ